MKRILNNLIIIAVWVGIWQIVSMWTGLELLLASPVAVFRRLLSLLATRDFYNSFGGSLFKIMLGFLLALLVGIVIGVLAGRKPIVEAILKPPVHLMKSLPMAAFIIVLLIWFGSAHVATLISWIVAFPMIYQAVIAGVRHTDVQMLEMAKVFEMPFGRRIRGIYLPHLMPHLNTAIKTALGMCWKAGVSAEVIGLTRNSIGEQFYYSKLYLMTADLFAWSLMLVVVSYLMELLILKLIDWIANQLAQFKIPSEVEKPLYYKRSVEAILVNNIDKSYGDKHIFSDFSAQFSDMKKGETGITCLMGASGIGKTTLLRIMMQLECADAGEIQGVGKVAAVFQENRLILEQSIWNNVSMVLKKEQMSLAKEILEAILPGQDFSMKVAQISGGMQRRVTLARALAKECDTLILDEPLNGLDEQTKQKVCAIIKQYQMGRNIVLVTHDINDVAMMDALCIQIP